MADGLRIIFPIRCRASFARHDIPHARVYACVRVQRYKSGEWVVYPYGQTGGMAFHVNPRPPGRHDRV